MYSSVFLMFVYAVGFETLRVRGPSDPLVVPLGGSVLLPCFVESPLPVKDLQVEWRKLDTDSVVSFLQGGENRPDLQTPGFRDRAAFFPDQISKGIFSILLINVVKEDAGVYRCQVKTTQDTRHVLIEIKDIKHFMVTGSDQAVFAREGDDVILNCSVDSHVAANEIEEVTWKKTDGDQNILVLLYQDGKIFPDSSHERFQGRVDLFLSEIPKGNFSLKLNDVNMEDKGGFTCEIHTSDMSGNTTVLLQGVEHLLVTGSDQPIFAREGDDVILNCSVDSHVAANEIEEVSWKKKDGDQNILVLLYQDGEIFPDSSHERFQGRVDLFLSEIPNGNFSLKLKDVKMEDKGEFTCEIHTSDMSGNTTVLLHGVGFSTIAILILVFCTIALLLAVAFCGPVFNLLRKKVATKKTMTIHISLVLCPNICMMVAFCLWLTEGFMMEVVTCATVSIMRPIMLMKTSSYLDRFPKFLQKTVKVLAVPLFHLSLVIGASFPFFNVRIQSIGEILNSTLTFLAVLFGIPIVVLAVYSLRLQLTVCLEVLNVILFALIVMFHSSFGDDYEATVVLPSLIIGILNVLTLQRHLFLGKPIGCLRITLSSFIMFAFISFEIFHYIIYSFHINDFSVGWRSIFVIVLLLCAWLVVVSMSRCYQGQRQSCCAQWRKIGYLCCAATAAFLIITYGIMSLYYTHFGLRGQDRGGYLALMTLLHVLAATCLFKHPKHLPDFLHVMIYMFGAVGLSSLNAIVLAIELMLKAGKGARNIEDLKTIVLPFEIVFVAAWLILQIYDAYLRFKDSRQFEDDRTGPEVAAEMEALSDHRTNANSE